METNEICKILLNAAVYTPLAGAVLHTAVGMKMVVVLFAAINCFGIGVMIACTAAVCVVFGIFYVICYKRTSGAYYRIVRGL